MTFACTSDTEVEATIAELKATLQSKINVGSSPDEVSKILQLHDIEHSVYHVDTPKISAIVRDVKKSLIGSTSIILEFQFENGKLANYTVEKAYTGL